MRVAVTARRGVQVPLLLFLGALLLQSAWILTLPPFRGTDEFDHAYRAAAVAGGQWKSPGTGARHGRGQLLVAPRTLVDAARPVCSSYRYTGHDNCFPVRDAGRGRVEVASAAAAYNPLFYAVIGTVAKPAHGASALYVMRVAAALLCAAFIAAAGWTTTLWARTGWPVAGLVVAATPVLLFSTAVAAPNGLEMCSALTVWLSLLGLASSEGGLTRRLLLAATAGALVLTTLRSIGPLWLLLITTTVLLLLGGGRGRAVLTGHAVLAGSCAAGVLLATVAAVVWTRVAGTNTLESDPSQVTNAVTSTLAQLPLWSLQGIAAFPRRNDPAPALTYALVGSVVMAFAVTGFRLAKRRLRTTMLVTIAVSVAVPVVLTIPTIRETGAIWQGRYGLPYYLGVSLIAGMALDRATFRHRLLPAVLVAGWLGLVVGNLTAVLHVLRHELRAGPMAASGEWLRPSAWLVSALVVAGFAAWGCAGFAARDVTAVNRRGGGVSSPNSASVDA